MRAITGTTTAIMGRCPTRSATSTITGPALRPAPLPITTVPPPITAGRARQPISARIASRPPAIEVPLCPVRPSLIIERSQALVAQLDRASDFDSEGREFESLRARHYKQLVELEFFRLLRRPAEEALKLKLQILDRLGQLLAGNRICGLQRQSEGLGKLAFKLFAVSAVHSDAPAT